MMWRPIVYACLWMVLFSQRCLAADFVSGIWSGIGEGAHGENGTVIIGVNAKTKALSGYYESSNSTGNITAECRFFFKGRLGAENVAFIQIVGVHPDLLQEGSKPIDGKVEHQSKSGKSLITIYLNQVPSSCDWLYNGLPSYVPPKNFTLKNGLPNEFQRNGSWQAVKVIRSERSYFYKQPNSANRGKAYLIAGDLIYIYDETPGWYYAEYQGEQKTIRGWIEKTDVIQTVEPYQ